MALKLIKNRKDLLAQANLQRDSIDWKHYDSDIELIFSDRAQFSEKCVGGWLNFSISKPASMRCLMQNNGWDGSFAAGDCVLWTNENAGPITFRFDKPIRGAGVNIDIRNGKLFKAIIRAYRGNEEIEIKPSGWRDDGIHNNNGDGKAIFIGFLEKDLNKKLGIDTLEFDIQLLDRDPGDNADTKSFAINKLDLVLE